MPLRDHFRLQPDDWNPWGPIHGMWPAMIVIDLNRRLPPRYTAVPQIHLGSGFEVDIAALSQGSVRPFGVSEGGPAAMMYDPPGPTLTADIDPQDVDEYEVLIFDSKGGRRLVAAIEIVSPSNKDRPDSRKAFVTKCAAMLREGVCVAIVDIVSDGRFDLSADLLEFMGQRDVPDESPIYAASIRRVRALKSWRLEAWTQRLEIGGLLPTLPLWLTDDLAVPLELESTYKETCRNLRLTSE